MLSSSLSLDTFLSRPFSHLFDSPGADIAASTDVAVHRGKYAIREATKMAAH